MILSFTLVAGSTASARLSGLSRERFSGVPSMFDSLGVKVPCPA